MKITLSDTLPNVFEGRSDIHSEVWRQDVSFEQGHTYLIEAQSGTGKSSLCSYLLGYRNDYSGTICFDDRNLRTISLSEWTTIRQRSLSMIFQELRLFPELTAWENVQIKNQLTSHKSNVELEEWFEALGIAEKMDAKVGRMSFGQQQRVATIRALAQPFDFLIADEPISHLDEENSRAMAELIIKEVRAQGAGLIITSIGKHMELSYDKILKL